MKVTDILNESSLSRLYRHAKKHDSGIISAFRYARDCNQGKPYTHHENLQRNASLLAKLRANRYSVTAVRGSYIEHYKSQNERDVQEYSFFVVDIFDKGTLLDDLLLLGELFDQDAILWLPVGEKGQLIGTSKCDDAYPPYGQRIEQDFGHWGMEGVFNTKTKDGSSVTFLDPVAFAADHNANLDPNDPAYDSKKLDPSKVLRHQKSESVEDKGKPLFEVVKTYGVLKYPSELRGAVILANKPWSKIEISEGEE